MGNFKGNIMARLHEYQGKILLNAQKIAIPRGGPARSPAEARTVASTLGCEVAVKAQAWVTGRASQGAIRFAANPNEAALAAKNLLGLRLNQYVVDTVLVEEKLAIQEEYYAGVIVDDRLQAPVVIFSRIGGTGIEEAAGDHPEAVVRLGIDVTRGLLDYQARDLVRQAGFSGKILRDLGQLLVQLYQVARSCEARAVEINPIALTTEGQLVAADCRLTLDDYAVYRHPELGVAIAREFDRPPTPLEVMAWQVEKNDYRGTFYFIQLEQGFNKGDRVVGFHGAGGGGSMMSMDAVLNHGFQLANFVDTSGNPPASKVYRAARLILAQEGLDGYFASGSGVASQEQFHSARGLVKAFLEVPLTVPAVIRLGGNAEERAIAILERAQAELPAPLEAFGKDDPPEFCAARLAALVKNFQPPQPLPPHPRSPAAPIKPYRFETVTGGTVTLDHAICQECASKICVQTCVPGILGLEDGLPVLTISRQEALRGGCSECLACEIECYFGGNGGGKVHLPILGLDP